MISSDKCIRKSGLRLARSRFGGRLAAAAFAHFPFLIPGVFAVRTGLVVFSHPVPMTNPHLVVVPRRWISDARSDSKHADAFSAALETWINEPGNSFAELELVTNLGVRQEVRFLHVHVIPRVDQTGTVVAASSSLQTAWAQAREVVNRGATKGAGGSLSIHRTNDKSWTIRYERDDRR